MSKPEMPSLSDHKDDAGDINWATYRAAEQRYKEAQVANGTICRKCGEWLLWGRGDYPRSCYSCESLAKDRTEVSSDSFVRCPKCRHTWNPLDDPDGFRVDEETGVSCPVCDHAFDIKIRTTHTFYSPPLEPEPEPEAEEEEVEDEEEPADESEAAT